MVKKLDDSVGDIVKALFDKGILDNTIIVFVSDNGGMTTGELHNYASNYPMRGIKMTPFEGGVRVAGLIWSASLRNATHYWNGYMHVTDWMPTLLTAVGVDVPSEIDGINQWENINSNLPSHRNVMFEIDDYTGYSSIIYSEYKLVTGNVIRNYSNHQGADLRGVVGEPPSYSATILNSTVYRILQRFGRPFNIAGISLRQKMVVDCKHNISSAALCFPNDGKIIKNNVALTILFD